MTPLAQELLEDLTNFNIVIRPTGNKTGDQLGRILTHLVWNCKFFDFPEAPWQMALQLAAPMYEAYEKLDRVDQRLAFLPAEYTWIESESPGWTDRTSEERVRAVNVMMSEKQMQRPHDYLYRTAHVFVAQGGVTLIAKRYRISYETPRRPGKRIWRCAELPSLPLVQSGQKPQRYTKVEGPDYGVEYDKPVARIDDFVHYAALALINTPRIIGQRIHRPHERLEREKLKKLGLVGKFPLHAWTEIILKIAPPDDRTGEPSVEGHLTGERCLHFCRTYIRVRLGMIEYIEGHWRGNPALGMKRSRYRLEPETFQEKEKT